MTVGGGEIEAAARIVSGEIGRAPLGVSPLVGKGSVNRVYVVETEISRLVVRINDADRLEQYEKEAWCSARAAEKQIPVPEILKTGIFGDRAYSVQQFVEGAEGRDSSLDKKVIWKKLGQYAARIHAIETAGFGLEFRELTGGHARSSWLKHLDYNIGSLNADDDLLRLGVLTQEQSARARRIFASLRRRDFKFGLNHGDLSLKNVVAAPGGTVYLLDWGEAEAHVVPHHDFIELLKMQMLENDPSDEDFRAFLGGYGIGAAAYEKMLPELAGLILLRAFDKLRWALDRKVPELAGYIFEAKETVENFLR